MLLSKLPEFSNKFHSKQVQCYSSTDQNRSKMRKLLFQFGVFYFLLCKIGALKDPGECVSLYSNEPADILPGSFEKTISSFEKN